MRRSSIIVAAALAASCGDAPTFPLLGGDGFGDGGVIGGRIDAGARDGGVRLRDGGLALDCDPTAPLEECFCPSGASGTLSCPIDGSDRICWCADGTESDRFDFIRSSMVGSFEGTCSTPWTPDYSIAVRYGSDEHYSARALESQNYVAFYYASDEDDPDKIYHLNDLLLDGTATGDIFLVFGPGNAVRGELKYVSVSPDGNHLEYEYWHNLEYGPVRHDLYRRP